MSHRYGTPWVSFDTPQRLIDLAREQGFSDAQHVSLEVLAERYFHNRTVTSSAEHILIATTTAATSATT